MPKTVAAEIEIGVVGIGLMGSSIIVSLLAAGHPVKAIAPILADYEGAGKRIKEQLENCAKAGLLKGSVEECFSRVDITTDYSHLSNCALVMECVIESIGIKEQVYQKIAAQVSDQTIISTNTSALAITLLQKLVPVPGRFIGIHFAEPAYATRFLEITCGAQTLKKHADRVFKLAHHWGKEPTVLRKDIRGFITNRLMYAVYRELFHLVESGKTNMEDADKAFRYDAGSWMTLMGIFRRMDYTGLGDYAAILENLLPQLSNTHQVPAVMQEIVQENGRGIQNLKGLYPYTPEQALAWAKAFADFNKDIFRLAAKYPSTLFEKEKIVTN